MKVSSQQIGRGKLGNTVYKAVAGVCIASEKPAKVSNPNTEGQVAQRAKLKLASQLSAAMASSIVIPKKGLVSARNQFIQKNIGSIIYSGNAAQVSYENLQLTAGNIGLPSIEVNRTSENLTIHLLESAGDQVNRVVYEVYRKSTESQLIKVASVIISDEGTNGDYPATMAAITGDVVVYAYGMIDKDAAATAKYNNYGVTNGSDIARLVANRTIGSDNYRFTQTRGLTLFSNENNAAGATEGVLYVYITAGSGGTVAGQGFANGRKQVTTGDSVTVTATPDSGNTFQGWYQQAGGSMQRVSTAASYTFTVGETNVDLVAQFNVPVSGGDNGGEEGGL